MIMLLVTCISKYAGAQAQHSLGLPGDNEESVYQQNNYTATEIPSSLIINQVYGAGTKLDNTVPVTHGFVELYNPTSQAINLSGWSLQYSPGMGKDNTGSVDNKWQKLELQGTVPANCSFLVRAKQSAVSTADTIKLNLNYRDQDWNIFFNNKGVKFVLLNNTTLLTLKNPFNIDANGTKVAGYVDMFGVGGNDTGTNDFIDGYEGSYVGLQSKQKAFRRIDFTDTNNNAQDFELVTYNTAYIVPWAKPRCVADGAWTSSGEKPPQPNETQLDQTRPNTLTNTFGADPKTTRLFTWQTPTAVTAGKVQILPNTAEAAFPSAAAQEYAAVRTAENNKEGQIAIYRVSVTGLQPGSSYIYRAGSGDDNGWSNTYNFTTHPNGKNGFVFLHASDTQATTKANYDVWGSAAIKMINKYPQTGFILETGDLIDTVDREDEWRSFFTACPDVFGDYPFMPVVGNHEQTASNNAISIRQHFTVVGNGASSPATPGTTYSFDYGDAHFAVLNTESDLDAQKAWLEMDLASTSAKWKIVALHRGLYGAAGSSSTLIDAFEALLNKYHVDLILQGHDHVYMRSYKLANGHKDNSGTVHLESGGSGSKQDILGVQQDYQEQLLAPGKPTFSAITVSGDTLSVATEVVNGTNINPLESFSLTKTNATTTPDDFFVQVSDLHLCSSADAQSALKSSPNYDPEAYAAAFVNEMLSLRPSFVAATGDLVALADKKAISKGKEWFNIYNSDIAQPLSTAGIMLYNIPGNHDQGGLNYSKYKSISDVMEADKPYYGNGMFTLMTGSERFYSFDRGDYHYIVLDPSEVKSSVGVGFCELPADQLSWLQSDLTANASKNVVIFFHQPSSDWTNWQAVLDVLKNYKVKMIFNGHWHVNTPVNNGLPEQSTGALCGSWWRCDVNKDGSPFGYRLVCPRADGVRSFYKKLSSTRQVDLVTPVDIAISGQVSLCAQAYDANQNINAIQYRIDGGTWQNMSLEKVAVWYDGRATVNITPDGQYHQLEVSYIGADNQRLSSSKWFKFDANPIININSVMDRFNDFQGRYATVAGTVTASMVTGYLPVIQDQSGAISVWAGECIGYSPFQIGTPIQLRGQITTDGYDVKQLQLRFANDKNNAALTAINNPQVVTIPGVANSIYKWVKIQQVKVNRIVDSADFYVEDAAGQSLPIYTGDHIFDAKTALATGDTLDISGISWLYNGAPEICTRSAADIVKQNSSVVTGAIPQAICDKMNSPSNNMSAHFQAAANGNSITATIKAGQEEARLGDSFDVAPLMLMLTQVEREQLCSLDSIGIGGSSFTRQNIVNNATETYLQIQQSIVKLAGQPSTSPYQDLRLKQLAGKTIQIVISGQTINLTLQMPVIDECFIATAAFGSKFTWPVVLLRHFRDDFLLKNSLGQAFVNFYYHNSPPIARYIAASDPLRMAVRVIFIPVVALVYTLYHPHVLPFILLALIITIVIRKRWGKKYQSA